VYRKPQQGAIHPAIATRFWRGPLSSDGSEAAGPCRRLRQSKVPDRMLRVYSQHTVQLINELSSMLLHSPWIWDIRVHFRYADPYHHYDQ
jgi:hypothetical protein